MTVYLLLPLVLAVFCLILLVALVVSGLRHVARKPFAFFLGATGLWGLFIFFMRAAPSLERAFLWEKLVFFAILSAALFFYRFTISFTGNKGARRTYYAILLLYIVSMALVPTGLVITGMQQMWYGKAPILGPLFPFYVLAVYLPIIFALRELVRFRNRTRVLNEKVRATYIAAGIIVMFIGGTTDYLPAVGLNIYPMGIIGNIIFCLMATVAMLRYGLLEFRVVLRRGAAVALVSIAIFGIVGLIVFALYTVFPNMGAAALLAIFAIAVLALLPASQPVISRMQKLIDRWFYGSSYEYLRSLENFFKETKDIVDLNQLSASFVDMVARATQASNVYLLLPDLKTGDLVTRASCKQEESGNISFSGRSVITQAMQFQSEVIDVYDIDSVPALHSVSKHDLEILQKNNIELMVPLKTKERLAGILLLASRSSGKPYSTEDRRLLETASYNAAVTIENARLYEELKQQLVITSKMASLGELASYVAHEVNNGLQGVINYGTLLRQDLSANDQMRQDLIAIEAEALRARNIVETLLGIVRRERVEKGVFDINDLLRSVVTLGKLRAKAANVTITEKYLSKPLLISGSPDQLRQVFLNLFANATDAMPNGGEIKVETMEQEKQVIITVEDSGIGIPADVIDKIWDPLFTTKSNGTGLGLKVSLSIVREHGGTITVASEVNKGTKFTISLPEYEQTNVKQGKEHVNA